MSKKTNSRRNLRYFNTCCRNLQTVAKGDLVIIENNVSVKKMKAGKGSEKKSNRSFWLSKLFSSSPSGFSKIIRIVFDWHDYPVSH